MKVISKLLLILFLISFQLSEAQNAIGYVKVKGNDSIINLRVISEADAIAAGHGVFSITLKDGRIGAAELVSESDPLASEVRIQMPQGTKAWIKENYFSYSYGGIMADKAYSLVQTSDNGFAVCGSTRSFGNGGSDFMFLKVKDDGEFDWGKALGFSYHDEGKAIILTQEEGYFLAGYAFSLTYHTDFVCVYHIDNSGNVLFVDGYGTEDGDEYAEDCIQTDDNNFVIIGSTDGMGAGGTDIYISKVDYNDGNLIWGWSIGTMENEWGYSIVQRSNGGFVTVGDKYNGSDWDIHFMLLDSGGNEELSLTIGGDGNDFGRDVVTTSDGGYVLAGYSSSGGGGGSDCYLRKLDSVGNYLWGHYYGGTENDDCNAIIQTCDNNLVMVGRTYSYGAGLDDLLIIKTDSLGNGMWAWVFGTTKSEKGLDILEGSDGCLYVCGETSNGAGNYDAFLVKFAGDGSTCMGFQMGFSNNTSQIFHVDSSFFKAEKVNFFNQSVGNLETKKIHNEAHPFRSDIIPFKPMSRDDVYIAPTVTTICN